MQSTKLSESPFQHQSCSLAKWFIENQCIGSENVRKDFRKHTFRDNDGALRYMESWLPAPEEGSPYILPGSYELYLSSIISTAEKVAEGNAADASV